MSQKVERPRFLRALSRVFLKYNTNEFIFNTVHCTWLQRRPRAEEYEPAQRAPGQPCARFTYILTYLGFLQPLMNVMQL